MSNHFWWYMTRSSGMVAWLLLTMSVIWGLLVTTKLLRRLVPPKWLLDLHRHLGGLALAFTALHLGSLVADTYVDFSIRDLLVPFASSWKPAPVALGVMSLYLLAAIEITSLARKHLPRRWWHRIHLTSYLLFWSVTVHAITAGTDAVHPAFWAAEMTGGAAVLFLTFYRIMVQRNAGGRPATPRANPVRAEQHAKHPLG